MIGFLVTYLLNLYLYSFYLFFDYEIEAAEILFDLLMVLYPLTKDSSLRYRVSMACGLTF